MRLRLQSGNALGQRRRRWVEGGSLLQIPEHIGCGIRGKIEFFCASMQRVRFAFFNYEASHSSEIVIKPRQSNIDQQHPATEPGRYCASVNVWPMTMRSTP